MKQANKTFSNYMDERAIWHSTGMPGQFFSRMLHKEMYL